MDEWSPPPARGGEKKKGWVGGKEKKQNGEVDAPTAVTIAVSPLSERGTQTSDVAPLPLRSVSSCSIFLLVRVSTRLSPNSIALQIAATAKVTPGTVHTVHATTTEP